VEEGVMAEEYLVKLRAARDLLRNPIYHGERLAQRIALAHEAIIIAGDQRLLDAQVTCVALRYTESVPRDRHPKEPDVRPKGPHAAASATGDREPREYDRRTR